MQTLSAMHTAPHPPAPMRRGEARSVSRAPSLPGPGRSWRSLSSASRVSHPGRGAGLTLWSWLVLLGLGALVLGTGARCLPVLLEYQSVTKAAHRAARAETVAEARAEFDRTALVEGVRAVQGADLVIEAGAGGLLVRFAYQREVPLAGPAYLAFKLSGGAP